MDILIGAEKTYRVIAIPLATTCEKSVLLQSILDDCRKVNYILNKSEEGYLRNYTMVGLTLVLGKIVEHVLLESIFNM